MGILALGVISMSKERWFRTGSLAGVRGFIPEAYKRLAKRCELPGGGEAVRRGEGKGTRAVRETAGQLDASSRLSVAGRVGVEGR